MRMLESITSTSTAAAMLTTPSSLTATITIGTTNMFTQTDLILQGMYYDYESHVEIVFNIHGAGKESAEKRREGVQGGE